MIKLYSKQSVVRALLFVFLFVISPCIYSQSDAFIRHLKDADTSDDPNNLGVELSSVRLEGEKTIYGYLDYDAIIKKYGIVSFPLANPNNLNLKFAHPNGWVVTAGAYAHNKYYLCFYENMGMSSIPKTFSVFDLDTGNITDICSISNWTRMLRDMSFDYSTNTMYGVTTDNALVKINLETGELTDVGKNKAQMHTLGCSYEGQLYTVSLLDGYLYKINKNDASVEPIGATGIYPVGLQSMDFDHDSNTLYWAAMGMENKLKSYFMSINTETGVANKIADLLGGTEITALYIPFVRGKENVPNAVSDFTATPNTNGLHEVTLSWVNPSKTLNGEDLTELLGVKIFRDDVMIKSLSTTMIGEAVNYKDADVTEGSHFYKVIAYNNLGDGKFSNGSKVYVGYDIPAAALNLVAVADGTNAKITWTNPAAGINGGNYDIDALRYKIERLPDNIILSESITGNEYIDNTISELKGYSYVVTSISGEAIGGSVTSNIVVMGNNLPTPYSCDFQNVNDFNLYTIIDANNDGSTWKRYTSFFDPKVGWLRFSSVYDVCDDWVITPPIVMHKDKKYKLSFDLSTNGPAYKENLTITIGKGATVEAQSVEIVNLSPIIHETSMWYKKEIVFEVEDSDNYNIGFYSDAPGGQASNGGYNNYQIQIDNLLIEEIFDNDLSAKSVSGSLYPIVGSEFEYLVKVKNTGIETQNRYIVRLIDDEGNELATKEVTENIEPNNEKDIVVLWTPSTDGSMKIRGEVLLENDSKSENNISEELLIDVQIAGSLDIIKIGTHEQTNKNALTPFDFTVKTSTTQTIYLANEMKLKGGVITEIKYSYDFESEISNNNVKIYLANTLADNLNTEWIGKDEFTPVYEGVVNFPKGKNTISIPLDTPYLYNGTNLCVMTEKTLESNVSSGANLFSSTNVAPNTGYNVLKRTKIYTSNKEAFDFTQGGALSEFIADVIIVMDTQNGSKLQGTVSVGKEPCEGATITIAGKNISKTSDSKGQYQFDFIPVGTYNLIFSKYGYTDKLIENVVFEQSVPQKIDVVLTPQTGYKVSGVVVDSESNPVTNANISIIGYGEHQTTTNENGEFEVANVYGGHDYMIRVISDLHSVYESTLSVVDEDIVVGDIELSDLALAPHSVNAIATDSQVEIEWSNFTSPEAFNYILDKGSYDNGTYVSAGGNMMIGNKFENDKIGVLSSIQVFGLENAKAGNVLVNAKIFDKDRNQIGESEPFKIPSNRWLTVPIDNVQFNGTFYVMLHWDNLPEDTNWLTSDEKGVNAEKGYGYVMKNGVWALNWETGEHSAVYMIRASGLSEEQKSRKLNGFNVYRLKEGDEKEESKWTEISTEELNTTFFTDTKWRELSCGVYKYAVKALYHGDKASKASFSNALSKDMLAKTTIKVVTNVPNASAEGAIVKLINKDGNTNHSYESIVNADGNAEFENVWKGIYSATVSLTGFTSHSEENINIDTENSYTFGPYTLNEIIKMPFNLRVDNTDSDTKKLFKWNVSYEYFDDFEDHKDFAINSPGEIGWRYIDKDNLETFHLPLVDFANEGNKMAFIIFNSESTTPKAIGMEAFSGNKCLASIVSKDGPNNDYIISPELDIPTKFKLSFKARTFNENYGYETFRIGYSSKTSDIKDFKWKETEEVPTQWTTYTYDIPKGTKYVTINCNSDDKFVLLIDDVFLGLKNESSKSLDRYEVFLNNKPVGETREKEYQFENLEQGIYKAGVKSIFSSGSSEMVTIDFEVIIVNVESLDSGNIKLFPNPMKNILNIEGQYESIEIYDTTGKLVITIEGNNSETHTSKTINVESLQRGTYIVKVYSEGKISTYKMIK